MSPRERVEIQSQAETIVGRARLPPDPLHADRRWILRAVCWLLAGVLALAALAIIADVILALKQINLSMWERTSELLRYAFGLLFGTLGTVLGYYFGQATKVR